MKLGMLILACAFAILLSVAGPLRAAPAGKVDADAEIARLQDGFKASADALAAERAKWLAALNDWYSAGLDKVHADRSAAGDLDGVLAVKAERARFSAQGETSADQIQAMPATLRTLRETYNASLKRITDEVARRTAAANLKQSADFEALQRRVTMTGDIEQALKIKRAKESFLAPPAPAAPVAPAPTPPAPSPGGQAYLTDVTPPQDANPVVLSRGKRITTNASFKPPVEVTVVAKTEDTNLRIGYAADQIIFNWERGQTEFRIDGGPGAGKHKRGAGGIPKDTFVTVRWRVTPEKQSVFVDDELRFEHEGDYSKIDKPVTIFATRSTVTVQSVKVQQLPPGTK
jgi:hypothetical protein